MKKAIFLLLLTTILSCVSIPKESVTLSESLGSAITETEKTHFSLLKLFFKEKRQEVDLIIDEFWVPTFAKDFFSIPEVSKKWEEVCASNDSEEKLKFITTVGIRVQKKINDKRQELIIPLDEMERVLEEKLLLNYNSLKLTNSTLTNYLQSLSKVRGKQISVLNRLGIEQSQLDSSLIEVYSIMDQVTDKVSDLEKGEAAVKEYLDKLKKLKDKLKTNKDAK